MYNFSKRARQLWPMLPVEAEALSVLNPAVKFSTLIVILASVYFIAGKLGLLLASVHPNATAVWPPTGITLAAFLLLGYRVWPGIFLGAFLVNATTGGSTETTLGIAAGNTLEGLLGAYLVNRFASGRHAFDHAQDILKFVVLAGIVSTAVSATCGVISLSLGGFTDRSDLGSIWLTWWLGDVGGALIVTPLIVLWALNPHVRWNQNQISEATFLLLMLLVVGQVVFGGWLPVEFINYPFTYLCAPILVWTAFRFGPRETATASFLLAGLAIRGTLHGSGPFAAQTQNESLLLLQTFMIITAITTIGLATVIDERKRVEAARDQLAAIVESSHDAIIGKTMEGNIFSWNEGAKRIFGYTADEVIGKPGTMLIPPDRSDEEPRILARLSRGERIDHLETVRLRKDGQIIHVSLTISPVKDAKGTIIGVSKIARDISGSRQTEKALEQTNQELAVRISELEQRSHEIDLLSEMGGLLQTCHTLDEAYMVIGKFAPQLFLDEPGMLGVSSAQNIIEAAVLWHEPVASKAEFRLDDCWALRRAQIHGLAEPGSGPFCQHLNQPFPASYLCVPLMAESETLGVLYVQGRPGTSGRSGKAGRQLSPATQRLALTMAHQIALAVANLKLRANLRMQAIRDPLTGLFNRRYLAESFELELRRAHRGNYSVGVIMLDVDHFKRVNDTFGHSAGDTLLREVAKLLEGICRKGDLVSRFGGEEFILVLPAASLPDTKRRADTLRKAMRGLQVSCEGHPIGPITISLGVAVFPMHGQTSETLIQVTDAALYQAKQAGRDRIVIAESVPYHRSAS